VSNGRYRVLLVTLLVVLLAACASHRQQRSGGTPEHTTVKTFQPYRADGELAVKVADVAVGHCWTTSITAPTSGAYRCIAGNEIRDPCFASPKPTRPVEVACIADPWSRAEVLQVTGALPKPAPGGDAPARPWALELGNGARCVAAGGMVPQIRGVNLGYHCGSGRDAGKLDTSAPVATAEYGDQRAETLRTVMVTTIWQV
jgi:hypothetical protein